MHEQRGWRRDRPAAAVFSSEQQVHHDRQELLLLFSEEFVHTCWVSHMSKKQKKEGVSLLLSVLLGAGGLRLTVRVGRRPVLLRELLAAGDGVLLWTTFGLRGGFQASTLQDLRGTCAKVWNSSLKFCIFKENFDASWSQIYHFLPLHPSVLVPGLHLQLAEAQRLSQVYSGVGVVGGGQNSKPSFRKPLCF